MSLDLAATEHPEGGLLLHRADCPLARTHAALGLPVLTMFGCKKLPKEYPKHSCLG